MMVKVKMFAIARDLTGQDEVLLELTETATVADMKAELVRRYPQLENIMSHVMVAIDSEYAASETPLQAGCQAALIPPVSGG